VSCPEGAAKGSEETPGHVVPAAENAEAGDKHARTEEAQPSGSPKKGAKKPKTDAAEAGKDQKADNSSAQGLDSAVGNTLKPASPTKGGAAASKGAQPDEGVKTAAPSSPKKAAPSSPKKGASSPKKQGVTEKVEDAVKKA